LLAGDDEDIGQGKWLAADLVAYETNDFAGTGCGRRL